MAHVTVVFRASFFKKFGLYSLQTEKNEDFELWYRSINKGAKLANIKDVTVYVRVSDEFLNRRAGFKKVLDDAKYRMLSIPKFNLSKLNYIWVLSFLLYSFFPKELKKLILKHFRN